MAETDRLASHIKRRQEMGMWRYPLMLALVALMGSWLLGCQPAPPPETYSDPSQTIKVSLKQEFVIALESNPSTGYDWQPQYDGRFMELLATEFEPYSKIDSDMEREAGAGGIRSFTFRPLKTGMSNITMLYKRPWEEKIQEVKIFTISIK